MAGYQEIKFRPRDRYMVRIPLAVLGLCALAEAGLLISLHPAAPSNSVPLGTVYTMAGAHQLTNVTIQTEDRTLEIRTTRGTSLHSQMGAGDGPLGVAIQRLTTADPGIQIQTDPQAGKAQARTLAIFLVPAVALGAFAAALMAVAMRVRPRGIRVAAGEATPQTGRDQ